MKFGGLHSITHPLNSNNTIEMPYRVYFQQ